MEKIDSELIKETLAGNLVSFETIVRRYQKCIFVHALRLLKDRSAAEDAAQETFVRAFEHLKTFDCARPIKPWLYKIATFFCIDYWRKNSRLIPFENEGENYMTDENLLESLIKKETIGLVKTILKKLPEKYFQPIYGYYFQNLSYSSLAGNLNISINTVRTRIRRAKGILLNSLSSLTDY